MKQPLLLVLLVAAASAEEICLTGDPDPYLYFGDKTAYIFATRGLPNSKIHEVTGCTPTAFWLLLRPGSTNPQVDELRGLRELVSFRDNIISNYKTRLSDIDPNERICRSDLSLLEQWTWNPAYNETLAGQITADGYMSTQQMAMTWKSKFPGLFTSDSNNYLFKYPKDQPSEETFRAFTEGIFKDRAENVHIPRDNDEKLSNPYKSCPIWTKNVEENNETLTQRHIFETKEDYREMLSRISRRLGFRYEIHRDTVASVYLMCRYFKAWHVTNISPWCSVFSKDDLRRLEYAEDLETYYKYGYGQPLHKNIGCLPIKDMYNFFSDHISKEVPLLPLSMVTISSAPMLLTTLAALGAHWDPAPISGDNFTFQERAQARKWTTSTMAPYNGNIAAVLYKCTPNGNFQIKEEYQVLLLENEKPMYIEGCRVGLCDWSLIKNRFADLVTKCDLEFCNGAGKLSFALGLAMVGLLISQLSIQI